MKCPFCDEVLTLPDDFGHNCFGNRELRDSMTELEQRVQKLEGQLDRIIGVIERIATQMEKK
jgi:hypothetical protein